MTKKCNAVFQGGGIRGIGQVGAIVAFEEAGYEFEKICGTSVGAMAAAFLAVGYTANEIKEIMYNLNLKKFRSSSAFFATFRFFRKLGLYTTHNFEKMLEELYKAKNKTTFKDLKIIDENGNESYKLRMIAVDVTTKQIIVIPDDLKEFGINIDSFSIAKAVRMSAGIPLFYEPVKLVDKKGIAHYIVDGGILSNFPAWLMREDNGYPTFGFKFAPDKSLYTKKPSQLRLGRYIMHLFECMMENCGSQCPLQDKEFIDRTINISIVVEKKGRKKNVGITYFGIKKDEKDMLYKNGYDAAKTVLKKLNAYDELKKEIENDTSENKNGQETENG